MSDWEAVKRRASEVLERDKSGKGFVCPVCGSGSGSHGTGITTKDGVHFTCWAGCFKNEDIIGITARAENISQIDALLKLKNSLGGVHPVHPPIHSAVKPEPVKEKTDYTPQYLEWAKHITETDYHRGISLDTLRRYYIGYAPSWNTPNTTFYSPRLIIPVTRYSYIARSTADNGAYSKLKIGASGLFNTKNIDHRRAIFVVEGELDALSVIDTGRQAVALGSTTNKDKLLNWIQSRPDQPVITALDSDKAGREASEYIIKALADRLPPLGFIDWKQAGYKDASEFYMDNPNSFAEELAQYDSMEDWKEWNSN